MRIDKTRGKARVTRKGNQAYDTSLKQWVKKDPQTIIPALLPGAEYVEALAEAKAKIAQAYNALQDSVLALVQARFPDLKRPG